MGSSMIRAQYQELISWSPIFGGDAARISMVNERNEEFFVLLPFTEGRAFTALRKKALDVLSEAIEGGLEAGEYRWA